MNIVFVLSGFFPEHKAGTEHYVLNLAKGLMQKGYTTSVIIPVIQEKQDYSYESIPVYTFQEESKPRKKVLAGFIPPKGVLAFKKLLKKIKPEVVHFHVNNRLVNSFHIKAARSIGAKTVFTSHLSGIFCAKGNLQYMNRSNCDGKVGLYKCMACLINNRGYGEYEAKILSMGANLLVSTNIHRHVAPQLNVIKQKMRELNQISSHVDKVIAISKWIQETYQNNGIETTLIPQAIPQPVDLQNSFAALSDQRPISILFLGRITYIKGIHVLLDALYEYQQDFKLIIVGLKVEEELDYYNTIKSQVYNLKNHEWYENLDKEGVYEILSKADLLCLPSIVKEMAPLSILEAFHFKVPVIGANDGGIKDMIDHGRNGCLFQSGSSLELKKVLQQIKNNKSLIQQMSRNISINFSYEDLVLKHADLYSKI